MHWSFQKVYWVLLGLLTAGSNGQSVKFSFPQSSGITYGSYHVLNCGENNHAIYKLLENLNHTLQPSITDSTPPISSPGPAYSAFFKTPTNAPYINSVLRGISLGAFLQIASQDYGPPTIICTTAPDQVQITDKDQKRRDSYKTCIQNAIATDPIRGTNILILCPGFFTAFPDEPPVPVTKSQCMTVNPRAPTKFKGRGESIGRYMLYVILNGLVNLYVFAMVGISGNLLPINACLALDGNQSLYNAQQYVYYVANIRLGCTIFPQSSRARTGKTVGPLSINRIELLEVEGNITAIAANVTALQNITIADSAYPVAYNWTGGP